MRLMSVESLLARLSGNGCAQGWRAAIKVQDSFQNQLQQAMRELKLWRKSPLKALSRLDMSELEGDAKCAAGVNHVIWFIPYSAVCTDCAFTSTSQVRTGHGILEKSWNLKNAFPGLEKSWNFDPSHGFADSFSDLDSPPVFKNTLSDELVYTGIFENTPVGSVLGYVSCEDPDGDRIAYYSERSDSVRIIDVYKGEVILTKQLDREQSVNAENEDEKPNSVTFECVDLDSRGEEKSISRTYVDLVITVLDNNDEKPEFADSVEGLTFSVMEDDPVGTVLLPTITVTDRDRGINAKLSSFTIYCEPGDPEPCQKFNLNYTEVGEGDYRANIVLLEKLDYEKRVDYRTSIRAIDGPGLPTAEQLTASTGIRIVVGDSQDTNPLFTNQNLNFLVMEGVAVGSLVNFNLSARDGDSGAKRAVFVEILDDPDGRNLFRAGNATLADQTRGIYTAPLYVREDIDREYGEGMPVYTFTAKATELTSTGSLTSATATAVFTVNILDRNDNFPLFSNSTYTVTVPEMGEINSISQLPELTIIVNDPDEPTNAQYQLEIVNQTFSGTFGFTPDSKVSGLQYFYITVNNYQNMDYDIPMYRTQIITLRAQEVTPSGATGSYASLATVTVHLTDVDDNFPVFSSSNYEAAVAENAPNFTFILQVSARDIDSGLNGQFTYSISQESNVFYMNPDSGELRLIGTLDYETLNDYSFLVFATDKGSEPKISQAEIRIRVTDYNDIGPSFTLPVYTATVSENTTQFEGPVRVTATDSADPNANITYRIVSGNTPTNSFVLDRYTGVLSLREPVDYEQTPNRTGTFSLEIEASDNGDPPKTSTSRITVTVLDENNHAPVFNPSVYQATVAETGPPGKFVVQVTATDADFGSNGAIAYRIGLGSRDSFVVNNAGNVSVSNNPSMDYDVARYFIFQIIAIDGGSPQHSATANVSITVTDANNKSPTFSLPLYNAIIDEATAVGTFVLQVSATDPDSVHTLQYSINQDSIVATNRAGALVTSAVPYNYKNLFAINPTTGAITVHSTLNAEYVVEVAFQVIVTDVNPQAIGTQTDTSQVSITIRGTPNTALYFNWPWTPDSPMYGVPVLESAPVGTEIMTLEARDPTAEHSILNDYEIVPGSDPGQYFRLTTKTDTRGTTPGVLVLNKPLDYESGDLLHSVVVRATKSGRSVTATVTLTVQDFNDNRPEFTQSTYRFRVREDAVINSQVGAMRAIDADSASFGSVVITLGGGLGREDFELYQPNNDNTALLLVAKQLDYETRNFYTIDMIATDSAYDGGSGIRLDSRAVVEIDVIDVNDNTPEFTENTRNFSVPEIAEIQTELGQVLAIDMDSGLNGQITYSLIAASSTSSGNEALQLFSITDRSGKLYTKALLQGQTGIYRVIAIAQDAGNPSRSSSMSISIRVQGTENNDGTPVWQEPNPNTVIYVPENSQTKLNVVFYAVARTPGASVVYSLQDFDGLRKFRINMTSGEVFVIADLDREIQSTYILLVKATDTLNSSLVSSRAVTVELTDIDDNIPSFAKSNSSACPNNFPVPEMITVPDDTPAGIIVGAVRACDPDGPGNNDMFYTLFTGNRLCLDNARGAFDVLMNGSIQANIVLDYEIEEEYLVCVKVSAVRQDAGRRRKRDFPTNEMVNNSIIAYVVISIADINDHGPMFAANSTAIVLNTRPSEPTVWQATAPDPDGPLHDRVRYDIVETMYYPDSGIPYSRNGAFYINPDSGVISTNVPTYDNTDLGFFNLTIMASDVENPLFNDTTTLTIILYQTSQLLRLVLNLSPSQGQDIAHKLTSELNDAGQPDVKFYLNSISEHRMASSIVATQSDICYVVVQTAAYNVLEAHEGISLLHSTKFQEILNKKEYAYVGSGACYQMQSSRESVKWRDLWWVLVAIAIFIFVCVLILIVTVCILYSRYKDYMGSQRTYLVVQ